MISIIIACYNCEQYIEDTLRSLANQKDAKSYEIIIVDDGSTDDSNRIIKTFMNDFPDVPIRLFHQENQGVSAARNFALKQLSPESRWVTFVDADDKVSDNYLSTTHAFFEKHPELSLAVAPIKYFGNKNGAHGLNYRFYTSKDIVNIMEDYQFIHFNIGGVFFHSELFEHVSFNENLRFWEDALLINSLLLEEKEYGLIKHTYYYYRKEDNDSLVNLSWQSADRYSALFTLGYQEIFNQSQKQYQKIIPYAQFLIIYHLKLFFLPENQVYDNFDQTKFLTMLLMILNQVDERFILEQPFSPELNSVLLKMKEIQQIPEYIEAIDGLNQFTCVRSINKNVDLIGRIVDEFGMNTEIVLKFYGMKAKKFQVVENSVIDLKIFNKKIKNYYRIVEELTMKEMILMKKIILKREDTIFLEQKHNFVSILWDKIRKRF